MDYDLSRLNTRSFEQLVQALAAKVIAPGIVVFGDGPDGGREASFDGIVPYPSIADQWSGTLVVQAKFRQRTQDTAKDTQWLLERLEKELEETFDGSSKRVRPTHYILATNVALSSVPETGGKARADAVAAQYPLKGFHLWDYDKLRTYLDDAEGIRNAFGAFISTGDVLAELKDRLEQATPDFDSLIANFLEKELLADQFANLEQAGRVAEEQIPISRVFIDLPTLVNADDEIANKGFIATSLEIATEKLNPESNPTSSSDARPGQPERGRLVLVGGPGQGKTTAGQFLCQLFRASLLEARPPNSLTPEARSALALMKSQCDGEAIPFPSVRRFPVRIALTELSDRLAERDGPNSLLEMLADILARRTSQELPVSVFREWLAEHPWLLVLDGLDEVPASSNRARVMETIRDFWIDATQAQADLLVIATTRPQGYNDDFSPTVYRHVALSPLSVELARRYGTRLAQARHPTDADRQKRIVARLEQASRNESTVKLMTSPLQVTIMATLVDRGGQPPEQRWKLFSEYYDVIYRRELEREIPAVRVLREHKPDIDAVHRRVALILQIEGEYVSHAEARMPTERFAAIVRARLQDEGHEEPQLSVVEGEIIKAAADRLVFLVGVEADEVGFEIRSLQEFMAGEALMDGGEKSVAERLRAIAGVTSWRNVFLFAAGHCFAERQHLRDTVTTICAQLNDPGVDPLAQISRPGSVLASDLLDDGFARTQPAYSRLLANEAMRLAGRSRHEDRLIRVYEEPLADIYAEALVGALDDTDLRAGAIAALLALDAEGATWTSAILEEGVPDSATGLVEVLNSEGSPASAWLMRRTRELGDKLSLAAILASSRPLSALSKSLPHNPVVAIGDSFQTQWNHLMDHRIELAGIDSQAFELGLQSITMTEATELRERLEESVPAICNPAWVGINAALDFSERPSAAELARQLRMLARAVEPADWAAIGRFSPWPLSAAITHAEGDPEALLRQAELAEEGRMGDLDEWTRAEQRWRETGLVAADLDYVPRAQGPYDDSIDIQGFPDHANTGMSRTMGMTAGATATLLTWLDKCNGEKGRSSIIRWLAFAIGASYTSEGKLRAAPYCECLIEQAERDRNFGNLELVVSLGWDEDLSAMEAAALDALGRNLRSMRQGASSANRTQGIQPLAAQLTTSWNRNENRSDGVFRLIALGLPADTDPPVDDPEIAARNPGASGLLQLKGEWTELGVAEGIGKVTGCFDQEPVWLAEAVDVIADRPSSPVTERAAKQLWDAFDSLSSETPPMAHLRDRVESLADDLVDQRATSLDQSSTWASLGFFKWPSAAVSATTAVDR